MNKNMEGEPKAKKLKTENDSVSNSSSVNENGITPRRIRIGSRKSQLALFQANFVMELLKKRHPEIQYEIVTMTTTGDNILNVPLSKIGQKSLFTKELEIALENNEVDVVVHSLKDLPTSLPPGMVIGAICRRMSPYDAVVCSPKNNDSNLESLPEGSVIGTSSLRRIAQLKRNYPHLQFKSVRGNLNTRLRKLDEENSYAALILAVAGLERMDLEHRISTVLSPDVCMYAVGQGALAVECKADNTSTLHLLSEITDKNTTLLCIAERAFMKTLEGGCSVPVAVSTTIKEDKLILKGGVFSLDGTKSIIDSLEAEISSTLTKGALNFNNRKSFCGVVALHLPQHLLCVAQKLGDELAKSFLESGADKILAEARLQNSI